MKSHSENKKEEFSIENTITIKSMLIQASNDIWWGKCITVPTTWASNGSPKLFENLLLNREKCGIGMVNFNGVQSSGNPNYATGDILNMEIKLIDFHQNAVDWTCFQLWVRYEMISKWIYRNLGTDAIRTIKLDVEKTLLQ